MEQKWTFTEEKAKKSNILLDWLAKIDARSGQADLFRIACRICLRSEVYQSVCHIDNMYHHNHIFPGMQRSVIIHLQLNGGNYIFPRRQAASYKPHGLIQNGRADAAVQCSGKIPHPWQRFTDHRKIVMRKVTIRQPELHHFGNGTWNSSVHLFNPPANFFSHVHITRRVRC